MLQESMMQKNVHGQMPLVVRGENCDGRYFILLPDARCSLRMTHAGKGVALRLEAQVVHDQIVRTLIKRMQENSFMVFLNEKTPVPKWHRGRRLAAWQITFGVYRLELARHQMAICRPKNSP
jgi:hypothetical protein